MAQCMEDAGMGHDDLEEASGPWDRGRTGGQPVINKAKAEAEAEAVTGSAGH